MGRKRIRAPQHVPTASEQEQRLDAHSQTVVAGLTDQQRAQLLVALQWPLDPNEDVRRMIIASLARGVGLEIPEPVLRNLARNTYALQQLLLKPTENI